jgi:hypothetical protein
MNECKEQDEDKYEQNEKNNFDVNMSDMHLRQKTIILKEDRDSL